MTRLTDPIAMEVFSNRLLSITEDMGNTLIRSSFSTNIKERKDCSVGLFDAGGRLIAQASHIPLHLGSLLGSVQAVLARYDVTQMRDGDAFVLNDPYLAGGTHMPDISIVTPVFIDGAVRAFAANVGHHSDVGGPVPGSISGRARSIFEEGLRLPVIRLVRARRTGRGPAGADRAQFARSGGALARPEGAGRRQCARRAADAGTGRPHGAGCRHRGGRRPARLHRAAAAQPHPRHGRRPGELHRVSGR